MTAPLRTLLFVPGSRPERFGKALAAGADAVIVDLEDAVPPEEKPRAREAVRQWLRPDHPIVLRINDAATPWFADDLALVQHPGVAAVVLPKPQHVETIAQLVAAGARAVFPLIESAAGFAALDAIAAAPGVQRLLFGSIDLPLDLGMRGVEEDELLYFRLRIVVASRLAGLAPPLDGVTAAIDDEARLLADAQRAARLGFGGKLCIHPRQLAAVRRAFLPGADEIAWARRVVAASAAAAGAAVQVDGKMVDRPVLLRAEAILRESGEPGRP